jgi:hypothetical protein
MKRVTQLLLIAALATVASTARAQDPDAKARATKLNQEAADHAKRGEWSVAAAMLAEAYRLTRDPALLVNLGATELKAGSGVLALHHLQAYMSDPSADPKIKQGVSEHLLPHAMAMTAHLNIHFPPGGRLTVDGEVEQVEPNVGVTLVDVMPGDHTVEISASGSSSRQTVTAAAGASIEVQAFPQAPPASAPAPAAAAGPSPAAAPSSDAAATGDASGSQSFWTCWRRASSSAGGCSARPPSSRGWSGPARTPGARRLPAQVGCNRSSPRVGPASGEASRAADSTRTARRLRCRARSESP